MAWLKEDVRPKDQPHSDRHATMSRVKAMLKDNKRPGPATLTSGVTTWLLRGYSALEGAAKRKDQEEDSRCF